MVLTSTVRGERVIQIFNMPKNTEEVKRNTEVPVDPVSDENESLRLENIQLREQLGMFADRLNRVEAIQSQSKLRKWDEDNDPARLMKTGRVLSKDGRDPILFLKKVGGVIAEPGERSGTIGNISDEQTLHGKTLSGEDVTLTYASMMTLCSGNSIPCVINNYAEYRNKEREIMEKRHQYQRSNGKTSRVNTVALKTEIKQLEEDIRMNVTLSEDDGKTFTGKTCDIHPISVLNALP